jgi:hypothetical protein
LPKRGRLSPAPEVELAAVILAALLAVACVAFVARPFLAEPQTVDDRLRGLSPADQERLRLVEQRDRALAALKELEFDHRTGKIADADYRELVGPLRSEAAEALQALEPDPPPKAAPMERVDAPA